MSFLYRLLTQFFLNTGYYKQGKIIRKRKVSNEVNEQAILEELLALLETSNVAIRNEPLGGSGGGLCSVKGEQIFFVDTEAAPSDTASLCAEAVAKVVDIEKVFIKPQVRQFIENNTHVKKGQ